MITRRRLLLGTLAGALAGARPGAAQPETPVPRVLFLHYGPADDDCAHAERRAAFAQGLADVGYVVGKTIVVVWRCVRAFAVLSRNEITPFDVVAYDDGLLAALTRGRLQLLGADQSDHNSRAIDAWMDAERMRLLKTMVPPIARIAVLTDWYRFSQTRAYEWERLAQAHDMRARIVLGAGDDLEPALLTIRRERLQGVVLPGGALWPQRRRIVEWATGARLPAIVWWPPAAGAAGLMTLHVDVPDLYRRFARRIDAALRRVPPPDEGERPKMNLVIDAGIAKAFGLTIPASLRQRADQIAG